MEWLVAIEIEIGGDAQPQLVSHSGNLLFPEADPQSLESDVIAGAHRAVDADGGAMSAEKALARPYR